MRKLYFFCGILFFGMNTLAAQSEETFKYANLLLLNSWTRNPDISISEFFQKYIPSMSGNGSNSLTSVAPPEDAPIQVATTHAVNFKIHPFFKGSYNDGEIQYLTLESNNVINGIRDIYLVLNYSQKDSGERDFHTIQDKFDGEIFSKKVDSNFDIIKVSYRPLHDVKNENIEVQMFFYKNYFEENAYHILFRLRPSLDVY
jgi:hypothetical protein